MNLKEELAALQGQAEFLALADYGHLWIEGVDAPAYLQRTTTNEVQSLKVGAGAYQAILDRKGMVRSLFYLLRTGPQLFHAIIPPQLMQKTEEILNQGKFIEKVTVKNVTQEWGWMRVINAPSRDFLDDRDPPLTLRGGFHWKDELFKILVWNILAPQNQTQNFENLPTISHEAFNILRIESGIPEYGIDIDETHILLEVNLPQFYKRQKGCYPGQEVIERILAYGKGRTPQLLTSLYREGDQKIPSRTEITTNDGHKVGSVTSVAFDPLRNQTVMLAYLESKYLSQGPFQIGNNIVRIFQAD